uniref:Methyltransferase domain-containing protein n=1 Tax=Trieres chinensis TaxID=1514140 RepID=A0A7S2ETP9_TRICV|mmetsp:Transcript_3907/g.8307  ORF Transcript_3907/g.8307 Transcript_3907/m.8307 type:complete len:212 (+) Transcript_3907:36-671(+)|eukprot:CAMPEP_0183297740 /NCGR_PEP_ID=MMETSP0160_2-20130417/4955_1 /TAXON_ID=2839 ORGANISM="Odontella Sinensis, Strain Grunow 1884" /NCGR_SAMPLE_ID=MMETSP0160_2 /ASSEMBLY_ACC=CAM_ASM_000250 /LENGTH=211 /DNA_ID=CAMNT_0025459625 /DNA_START=36 /DNA_END=671 /DNA_ORIENTATION=-
MSDTAADPTRSKCSTRLAPFNPTHADAQEAAIRLLELTEDDVLFDLGCGDGRFLLTAAGRVRGLRCVGVEYDDKFVDRAREALSSTFMDFNVGGKDGNHKSPTDIAERVEIRHGDVIDELRASCNASISSNLTVRDDATAIFVYLVPNGLVKIRPLLESIMRQRRTKKGCSRRLRVVTYMFSMRGWEPIVVDRMTKGECPVYLYDESSFKR